jgi:hypothetical protein
MLQRPPPQCADTARDQLVLATGGIADTTIDLVGAIGRVRE